MNKTHFLAVAVAAALASTVAIAQTAQKPGPQARVDANGDGVIDRAEAAKFPRLAARFDQIDANKDGKLDAGERPKRQAGQRGGKGMGMHGGGKRGGMQGMGMMRMDADNDGRISRAEAQAAATRLVERFDAMDANKDGYVDHAEMQSRRAMFRSAYFGTADTNKDGYLSRDEFAAHQKAMHAKRPQPGAGQPMMSEAQRAQRMAGAFDRFDADKDGRISKAEFESAQPMGGPGAGKRKGR